MQFEISLAKKRGTSDFVARGQLHCEFTASSARLSKERAGWQASTFKLKWLTSSWRRWDKRRLCFVVLFVFVFFSSSCVTNVLVSPRPQLSLGFFSSSTGREFHHAPPLPVHCLVQPSQQRPLSSDGGERADAGRWRAHRPDLVGRAGEMEVGMIDG